jgi:peroxiredoxin
MKMKTTIIAVVAWFAVNPVSWSAPPAKAPGPDFTLRDLDGKAHKLSDYRGKVVVLNFWATWCPPCRAEMPSMERTYAALNKKPFTIIGVEVGEEWETVQTFVAQTGVSYPILLDTDSSVSHKWSVVGLPTSYIIDPQGRVVDVIVGGRDWSTPAMRDRLAKLLPALRH